MRLACNLWSFHFNNNIKEAWKTRARKLNRHCVPGNFCEVPPLLLGHNNTALEGNVMKLLTLEWKHICGILHQSIMFKPKSTDSTLKYYFGRERVVVATQVYKTMFYPSC